MGFAEIYGQNAFFAESDYTRASLFIKTALFYVRIRTLSWIFSPFYFCNTFSNPLRISGDGLKYLIRLRDSAAQGFHDGFDAFFQLIGITFAQTDHAIEEVFRVVAVQPVNGGDVVEPSEWFYWQTHPVSFVVGFKALPDQPGVLSAQHNRY